MKTKTIIWILVVFAIVIVAIWLWNRSRKSKNQNGSQASMKDLSGFDPVKVRQAENECELIYNTNIEVNNCAYQKLTT